MRLFGLLGLRVGAGGNGDGINYRSLGSHLGIPPTRQLVGEIEQEAPADMSHITEAIRTGKPFHVGIRGPLGKTLPIHLIRRI